MFHQSPRSGVIHRGPEDTWSGAGRHGFAYSCRLLPSGRMQKVGHSLVVDLPGMFVFAGRLLSARSFHQKQQ